MWKVKVNYEGILVEGLTSQFFYRKGFSNKKPFVRKEGMNWIYSKITHFGNLRILIVLS